MNQYDEGLAELRAMAAAKAPAKKGVAKAASPDYDAGLAELRALATPQQPQAINFDIQRAALPTMPTAPTRAAPVENPNAPGVVESFVRGAGQTVTLGFADEISGAFESILTDKTYKQARDESRARFKAAEEANPIASMAGSIAGGFVPIPGMAGAGLAKGALALAKGGANAAKVAKVGQAALTSTTTGAAILRGAAAGAAAGVGSAEEDVVGGGLVGAAVGGVLGGGISAATKKLAGKLPDKITGNITDGSKARLRDAVAKDQDRTVQVILSEEAKPLRNALGLQGTGFVRGKDPAKVAEVADDLASKWTNNTNADYEAFTKATGGTNVNNFAKNIQRRIDSLMESPNTVDNANGLKTILDTMKQSGWHKDGSGFNGVKRPAREVRDFITKMQKAADFGSSDPGTTKRLRQEVATDLKDIFNKSLVEDAADHTVAQMAKRWGSGESAKSVRDELGEPLKRILENNEKVHVLLKIKEAAAFAAQREATNSPRIGKIGSGLVDAGLIGTGQFAGLGAKKALEVIAPRAGNIGSMAAFRLITAAKQGQPLAQLTQLAAQEGLPRAAAQKAFSLYSGAGASDE